MLISSEPNMTINENETKCMCILASQRQIALRIA